MSEQGTPEDSTGSQESSEDPTSQAPSGVEGSAEPGQEGDGARKPRVVVASPDGMRIHEPDADPTAAVSEPAKVMRLGTMIKQLLEEVRSAPLDEAARERLKEVHERSLAELESGLSPELVDELHRITLPFTDTASAPSDAELRVAQAQLVGWLEGLFHGIQTALVAQQMAAQSQLLEMRRALPPGSSPGNPLQPMAPGQASPGQPGRPDEPNRGTGQYL